MDCPARDWRRLHEAANPTTTGVYCKARWWHRLTRRRRNTFTLIVSGAPVDLERVKRVLGDPFKGA